MDKQTKRSIWVKRMLAEDPDYFRKLGKLGGRTKSQSKGFGSMSREKHRQASSKGGTNTQKNKAVDKS